MGKVTVRFGRPSQRSHHRLTAPLDIVVHGTPSTVLDWSTAGLRFRSNQPERFQVEETIRLALSVPFHDFNVSFDIQARIVRIDASNGDVAAQFVDLPERAKELLHYFSDKLVRGEMASVDGTLKRLDLPVTPPRPEAPKERAVINGGRGSVRPWVVGSTYLSLGVALAFGLLYTLYGTIFLVTSEQAMLYAPITELIAPEDGSVSAVYVAEGDPVAAGDHLLTITSPRLEQLQSEARIREQETLIEQQRLTELVETEVNTLIPYGDISADQVVATEARLASAQKQAALLERQRQRLIPLQQEGLVSAQQIDQLETDAQRAQGTVTEAQADLRIARMAHDAALSGKYYSANRLEGQLPELRAELSAAKGQVRLAKIRLQELAKQVDRLTLRAPIGGHVRQVSVMAGSAVSSGRLAISLLSDELPKVYAVVPSDKLARIAIGHRAKILIPALSRQISAEVTSIEPRSWSLPENVRRLLGGEPMDSGLVVLALASEEPGARNLLQPGLPVSVEMENETAQRAVRTVSSAVSYAFGMVFNAFGVTKSLASTIPPPPSHGPLPD